MVNSLEEKTVEVKENKNAMTAKEALGKYKDSLTEYEKGEILDYPKVFFTGNKSKKIEDPNVMLLWQLKHSVGGDRGQIRDLLLFQHLEQLTMDQVANQVEESELLYLFCWNW